MPAYNQKPAKLIQRLAKKQVKAANRTFVATMMTEPVLKSLPGPNSTRPLQEGEDPATFPGSVLAWFCDVRLDADKAVLRDVIVPTQARGNIGEVGSPVTVWKDPSTGAWQIIGRADRVNQVQSVKSYTLVDLNLGFIKGYSQLAGEYVSPFYAYVPNNEHIVTRTNAAGKKNAGLNRGIAADGAGDPIAQWLAGQDMALVPFGELDWGVDAFGVNYLTTYNRDGSSSQEKVQP